ncbi:MAG: hypothetical protein ACTIKR_08995, partial [Advenella sp.]|uniref:hypothetical protein n=1 Tax=Advenella sp. TaxID=1872388 RepID=UPI003F9D6F6A
VTPINTSAVSEQNAVDTSFDDALKVAQENAGLPAGTEQVFEQGIGMMMQTILSPRMNEILSESMSDE